MTTSYSPRRRCGMPGHLVAVSAIAWALASCTSTTGGATTVITASDTACEVGGVDLKAGKHTFSVTNEGDQVTEVYVYAPGERVVTEKENIGPGTTATFTADLAAGSYEVACKPDQLGDGIRRTITVTGAGGSPSRPADTRVQVGAVEYSFAGLDGLHPRTGETIEFELDNRGTMDHEFEVTGPDGATLGEVGPTKAGKKGSVTLTFGAAGTYKFVCDIDDHRARGMSGTFTVG